MLILCQLYLFGGRRTSAVAEVLLATPDGASPGSSAPRTLLVAELTLWLFD